MIQIYSPTNTDYTKNGNMVLFPESCDTHAKLNGEWYLDIEHPLDEEGRWKEIVEEAVISAPTFMGNNQLFRVDDVEKTDTEVKAKAYPIFFDSADELFVYSKTLAFVNGQTALNQLMDGTKYSGESNIARTSSAEFVNRNLMDCLNGDSDPAFIRYWGGDVLYDNYKVIINERAGSNKGVQIRYRKNMESIRSKVDMSNVVTRLVPIAYNGRRITGNYVDSPNVGKYAKVYTRLVEFPNVKLSADIEEGAEPEEGVTVCATQSALNTTLTNLCNELFAEGIDKPSVTLDVDMIDLSRTEEYKEFKDLEKVSLGDTVGVYHKDLDIDTEERCIELTWDCITNSAKKVVLGDYEYDYFIDGNREMLNKMREQAQAAVDAWKEKFQEIKDKFTEQDDKFTGIDEDINNIDSDMTQMEEDISGLEGDVSGLEEDMSTLEEEVYTEIGEVYARIEETEAEIQGKLDSATGMYKTNQRQSDGSYIYYLHDKSSLSSSTIVWKMTADSIAVSTNGGQSYAYGITCDGDAILNRLSLEELFAKEITATNMTLTGTSRFLSEKSNNKVVIENGTIVQSYSSSTALGSGSATHSAFNSVYKSDSTNTTKTTVGAGGVLVEAPSSGSTNGLPGMVGTLGFVVKKGSNKYGLTGSGFDVNGVALEPAYLRNGDDIGYVGLLKDGSYYYMRPYQASKVYSGSTSYPWYDTYTERLHVTKERLVCKPSYDNTTTYSPNVYVGTTGMFSRYSADGSSKEIKHDIFELGKSEELDAEKLYDLEVVQFKYNDGVITDKNDVRYGKDLPGFIIEDLDKIYPIAIDKPSDDVKTWTLNMRFLIPAMLKLIQEQNERLEQLEQEAIN